MEEDIHPGGVPYMLGFDPESTGYPQVKPAEVRFSSIGPETSVLISRIGFALLLPL
jgi:hypothetical protein